MNKRVKFLKDDSSEDTFNVFEKALNEYSPSMLEVEPDTPCELYKYYSHVDKMYIWLKNEYNDGLCMLCNEMRAILGHLSEYDLENEEERHNLPKAYGHLRRLSIDTLKVLCNGFDKMFERWIHKHARYDYSNIDAEYFPRYVELYNVAHETYIQTQTVENLGSDKSNKIIEKYHATAVMYCELYKHHIKARRRKIEKITNRFKMNKVIWVIATFLVALISVVGYFI